MPGWRKHRVESRLLGKILITSDMLMTTILMVESEEELMMRMMRVDEGEREE